MKNTLNNFWRAEVYAETDDGPGKTVSRKLFAGIYSTRKSAQDAAQQLCEKVRGFGFLVHQLKAE